MDINKLLVKLIKIESFSGNELRLCSYIYNLLKSKGFKVKKQVVDRNGFNIIAEIGEPKIILASHLDTVRGEISLKETSRAIYGRGACDAKGQVASMVWAALECKKIKLKNFGLIFTIGEEKDFRGAKKLISSKPKIPFIILGEPSSLKAVYKHFGMLVLKVLVQGKSLHLAESGKGVNTIEKLLGAIRKAKALKLNKRTFMSIVEIKGGEATNVIPSKASFTLNIRISPDDDTNYYLKFKNALKGSEVSVVYQIEAFSSRIFKKLSFIKKGKTARYTTELSFYKNLPGFKGGVIFGPGEIKYAHSKDEKILKGQLIKAAQFYKKMIIAFSKF